jgi:hypothetical protein
MTIEWLAGNRLRGTTAERPSASLQSPSVGGWVELARTTLGSTNADINISSLPNKRYYMILSDTEGNGSNHDVLTTFNSDTGSNYSRRYSRNGATDTTSTSTTSVVMQTTGTLGTDPRHFTVGYIANLTAKEKLCLSHAVSDAGATGAGTAPSRAENTGKWANTSASLDEINLNESASSADFDVGSECVVLGWDPADTHTTNFWEELASVEWSSGGTIDTGAFTAKKYLWVQVQFKGNSGLYTRFNSDSGSNYAWRYSNNGSADTTQTSITGIHSNFGFDTNPHFLNMFIINNASNEKLVISHLVTQNTAGAGNVSSRSEAVHKWANTSSQITSMQLVTGSGSFTGGQIKVWGAD